LTDDKKVRAQHAAPLSTSSQRRLGAPLSNHKAQGAAFGGLKYDFYGSHFKKHDLQDLESSEPVNRKDEIDLLRAFTRRVLAQTGDDCDLIDSIILLRTLCLAATTLSRLLKTQYLNLSLSNDFRDTISADLHDVARTGVRRPCGTSSLWDCDTPRSASKNQMMICFDLNFRGTIPSPFDCALVVRYVL
jgi:hypothetical protein